jgi:RNAse (barnase) inhibitor barstar
MIAFVNLITHPDTFKAMKFKNAFIATLDGALCKNSEALYGELKRLFEFPDYFGKNLDALYDCLMDLEWVAQDHVILIIKHFEQLLSEEHQDPELLEDFILTLEDACKSWELLDAEEMSPKILHLYVYDSERIRQILHLNDIPFKEI